MFKKLFLSAVICCAITSTSSINAGPGLGALAYWATKVILTAGAVAITPIIPGSIIVCIPIIEGAAAAVATAALVTPTP